MQNPIFFGKLICDHFDISMSQYGQVKKVLPFGAVPNWCVGSILQGLRTQILHKHIRAPPISMNITQTAPRHLPDIPQTYPGSMTCQQTTKDYNRRQKTLPDTLKQHMAVSWGVWQCLLASVVVSWHVIFPGDALGLSGRCLGAV